METRDIKTEDLAIDFYEVDAGWICFRVKIGEQLFDGRFSEVFDPIMDFKKWLEAIAIGVQQASFDFDPEGNEIKFDFERVCWNQEVLTICEPYEDGEVYIKANVNRKQVVNEFYMGLINFSKSDKYKPKEWEIEYLGERLRKALKISQDELVNQMLELDRFELKEFLFNADPGYMISFPEAKDKNEAFNIFAKSVFEGEKSIEEFEKIETPIEWNVPEYYDHWTSEKKKEYIIECLNEETEGYSGMKLDEFQSNIIGRYLYEE
jgi:hypothetical protein